VGVTNVIGEFNALDVVVVQNQKGKIVGKGQIYYSSKNLLKVKGLPSEQSKDYSINKKAEVIHRDNWVTMPKE
ncbi:MAG: PUA domain-containing protein, partial [Bacillus sp. (in: firmicutes)]